jgi:hypothetical protein
MHASMHLKFPKYALKPTKNTKICTYNLNSCVNISNFMIKMFLRRNKISNFNLSRFRQCCYQIILFLISI